MAMRLAERIAALLILPFVLVILAVIWIVSPPLPGRSFLHRSERMKSPDESFTLYKVRTMHPPATFDGERILGGDQAQQITRLGRVLRRSRLDELPQIFNIIRGDIGFVGPRPPLKKYVDAYPQDYARVLARRPGVTGLATVIVCRREERLLSQGRTAEETDAIYRRACIPLKVRLDLFFAERRSPALYAYVLFRTIFRDRVRAARRLRQAIMQASVRVQRAPRADTSQSFPRTAET